VKTVRFILGQEKEGGEKVGKKTLRKTEGSLFFDEYKEIIVRVGKTLRFLFRQIELRYLRRRFNVFPTYFNRVEHRNSTVHLNQ
jgi:hypothetical protein